MIPFSDTKTTGHFPTINVILILINIVVFILELTVADTESFILKYSLTPAYVNLNDLTSLIPLITSLFLHGGFLHIISNMLFLWVFGDNVEHSFGLWYLPFYLLCGIAASLTQVVTAPSSEIPMLGASGAVAGVLGAYLVLYPHHKIKTLVPLFGFFTVLDLPATLMLGYWFITQIFSGVMSISAEAGGGVAWFAHIGGFVVGWILAQMIKGQAISYQERLERHW